MESAEMELSVFFASMRVDSGFMSLKTTSLTIGQNDELREVTTYRVMESFLCKSNNHLTLLIYRKIINNYSSLWEDHQRLELLSLSWGHDSIIIHGPEHAS